MTFAPLLRLTEVSKSYEPGFGVEPIHVLTGITLEILDSESIAVVGPSGSGKSTLLNIIGTLDRPTSGQVFLNGEELNTHTDEKLAEIRNRQIGFVFQAHHLLPQCTVLENVLVPTLASKDKTLRQEARGRGIQLLKRVGLGERLLHRPGQLSGGERQRVAVVRSLINRPKLLLADEPTGALDRSASQQLAELLIDLNREEKVTLVVVTHAPDLADKMQRRFELKDGRLVA
ncbi:MAG: ABC transporter ATP-binding protein [Verrucomicrobiota bacterium]